MGLPAWLQNDSAWIAIGSSALLVVAGVVLHRVFLNILKAPPAAPSAAQADNEPRPHP